MQFTTGGTAAEIMDQLHGTTQGPPQRLPTRVFSAPECTCSIILTCGTGWGAINQQKGLASGSRVRDSGSMLHKAPCSHVAHLPGLLRQVTGAGSPLCPASLQLPAVPGRVGSVLNFHSEKLLCSQVVLRNQSDSTVGSQRAHFQSLNEACCSGSRPQHQDQQGALLLRGGPAPSVGLSPPDGLPGVRW